MKKYSILLFYSIVFATNAHDAVHIEFVNSKNSSLLGFIVSVQNNLQDKSLLTVEIKTDLKKKSPSVSVMEKGKTISEFKPKVATDQIMKSFKFDIKKQKSKDLQILIDYENQHSMYLIEIAEFLESSKKY